MNPLSRLKARLAGEGGFAVPTVMLMTVAALGAASVAVMTSVQGQTGTVRDQGSKTALSVAESGVSQALLHYNRGVAPCQSQVAGEWCGPVQGMSVNGGEVSYWARDLPAAECMAITAGPCIQVVSRGVVGGTERRVSVMASTTEPESAGGPGPFASAGVLSLDTITLDSNAKIHTGTATNGDILLSSNAQQCGPASVGIGRKMEKKGNAEYYADHKCTTKASTYAQEQLTLSIINQGDAATNNDNGRFFEQDVVSGNKGDACFDGYRADGVKSSSCGERELRVSNNSSVTITGSVYSFCKLTLRSNSALYVASGSQVTIYFDSPEACDQPSGTTQLDLQSNSRITSATGDPVSVAMLFVGSDSRQTRIQLNSNTSVNGPCEQNFIIYAPRSDVDLDSNSKFCGAIAGKSVHLDSNSEVWSATGSEDFNLPGVEIPETAPHYTPYRFVECSAAGGASPDAGC